jgi:phosphate:Na+ symporter
MVRQGFTRAYGTNLRRIIKSGTRNRFVAFGSGLAVTALLQSATATTLLLTSFARRRLVALPAALAVVLGADVATTLVAQALSFDLSWLSPALLVLGIIGYMKDERGGRKRHLARVLIGLGLMLLSLSLIREAAAPIKASSTLPLILGPLEHDPILAIIVAALITWIIHSSLASVLLFASLAAHHVIDLQLGLLLVVGANIGGALIPFAATYKDGPLAQRITFGNIFMRMVAAIVIAAAAPLIGEQLAQLTDDPSRQLVTAHTAFNVLVALIFMPLILYVSALCTGLFPEAPRAADDSQPLYLDEKSLDSPVIALAGAARETLRMAELVEDMLRKTIQAFETGNDRLIDTIRKSDNKVDQLYKAIKLYMTRLSQEGLDPKEADRYIQILTFSTNLEHIGDIIDKSLMDLAAKKIRQQENFSAEGFREIKEFHNKVLENMKMAQAIFMSEDPKLAAQLVEEKEAVRLAADDTSKQHFKRLSERQSQSLATSSLHLDIIRDYRRINSYATRVAYAILEHKELHKRGS